MIKKLATCLLAVGLVFGMAGPASAASKSGELYRSACTIQPSDPWMRAETTGRTDLKGPGRSSYYQYQNGSSYTVRYQSGTYNGGYWSAVTNGGLRSGGTYGFCRNP